MIVHTSANVSSGAGGFLRVWLPGRGRGPGSVSLSFDFSPSRVPHSTKEKRNEFFGVFVGIFLTAPTLNTRHPSIFYKNMTPRGHGSNLHSAMVPGLVLFKARQISWKKEQKQRLFSPKKEQFDHFS